jgi:putative ABC transport system permease protein
LAINRKHMSEQTHSIRSRAPFSWLFKMAWRDSRKNRSKLLLFTSSIILGIAALVAVYSFRDNLQRDIEDQAKTLTGADLIIDSQKQFSKPVTAMLDTLGIQRARQLDFISMLYFIKGQGTRLVQVKALEGAYPFYGSIETRPAQAASNFGMGKNVLVDKTVMMQFNAKPGDSVKIGKVNFAISGYLEQSPGQTGVSASVSPIVYIPLKYLGATGLAQFGSRIHYSYFYKFASESAAEVTLTQIKPVLNKAGVNYETVASKKRSTSRAFGYLNDFLALAGFIALLLGCIGVGSAIHVYIGEKITAISTLRCLGLKAWDAFYIYLIQITFIGLAGSAAGAVLGTAIQFVLPLLLKDFLPVDFTVQISWPAILQGIVTGVFVAVLFALPSLLGVRRISPLNAIRLSVEPESASPEPLKWIVYLAIFTFIAGFSYLQMDSLFKAIIFTLSISIAVLIFYGLSALLLVIVRKTISSGLSYTWRQGFSNLYRPNNQTMMLIVSIGLSTALIATLYFVQGILINKVTMSAGPNQPNLALMDIQKNQDGAVNTLLKQYHLPLLSQTKVVTMRLEQINGKTAAQLAKADSLSGTPTKTGENERKEPSSRAFRSELRATFQTKLTKAEEITSGKWTGRLKSPLDTVFVSLDEQYAARINVKVGDEMQFNVQGMIIPTVVGSLRKIDWARTQPNFRLVFPAGVLEDAPQFHVVMTRVPELKTSSAFQAAVVQSMPNVSVIDLEQFIRLLDELIGKISFVIRFMASFSMITGWIVLISAVRSSKNQRLKEIVLLRTLGAKGRQILAITAIEYLFLGMLSAAAGLLMAMAASWLLAVKTFSSSFSPGWLPSMILFCSITAIVVITGMLSSRSVLNHPPLEVLRKES